MTYRHPAHTVLSVIVTAYAVLADVKLDSHQISTLCCPPEKIGCCEEVIDKRLPLNCSMSLEELLSSSNCIQKEIYGSRSVEMARIEDVECCRVFTNEAKDANGVCMSTCIRTLRSPSLRSIDKLKSIKSCRPNNKDYNCFRRCQSFLRSRNNSTVKFPYLAVCDLADRLETGVLYLGPEVKD